MNFIGKNKEFDLIGFGEIMLRLSPDNKEKISTSESFVKALLKMQEEVSLT